MIVSLVCSSLLYALSLIYTFSRVSQRMSNLIHPYRKTIHFIFGSLLCCYFEFLWLTYCIRIFDLTHQNSDLWERDCIFIFTSPSCLFYYCASRWFFISFSGCNSLIWLTNWKIFFCFHYWLGIFLPVWLFRLGHF